VLSWGDRGRTKLKEIPQKVSESDALDAWANKIWLSYLKGHHLDMLKKNTDKAAHRWLEQEF